MLATPIKPNPFTRIHHGEIREVIASKLTAEWLDNYVEPALRVERSIKCYSFSEIHDKLDTVLAKHKDILGNDVLRLNAIQRGEETEREETRHRNALKRVPKSGYYVIGYSNEHLRPIRNKYDALRQELYVQCLKKEGLDYVLRDIGRWRLAYEHKALNIPENSLIPILDWPHRRPRRPGCKTPWGCLCCFDLETLRPASRLGYLSVPWVHRRSKDGLWAWREKYNATTDVTIPGVAVRLDALVGPEVLHDRLSELESLFKRLKDGATYVKTLRAYEHRYKKAGIRDFFGGVAALVRDAENEVRKVHGIPLIGEGWISETLLYQEVCAQFADEHIIQHGRPKWLGRQHFDIWFPDRKVAIEYHGHQHFEPIGFFGGETAFEENQRRDRRKKRLAKQHGVKLIVIRYDDAYTMDWLTNEIKRRRPN